MGKYHVIEPLRHDGDDLAVGSTVELETSVAEPLLASGVVIDTATAKADAEAQAAAEWQV